MIKAKKQPLITNRSRPVGYFCFIKAKIVLTTTAALCIPLQPVFSANPAQIENYDNDLIEAVKSTIGSGFLTDDLTHYLPGYGLHLVFEKVFGAPRLNDITEPLTAALLEQSDNIEGLPEGEWVSIFYRADGFREYDLLIRVKKGRPDTLEVWVDGLPT